MNNKKVVENNFYEMLNLLINKKLQKRKLNFIGEKNENKVFGSNVSL